MAKTTLKIIDQVNCKFLDLDPHTRRKMIDELKYFLPHAKFSPSYKLGRWDGTTSFANVSGATYINLLDRILPIIMDSGYEIDIDDDRPELNIQFPVCDESLLAGTVWPKGHPAEGEPIMLRDYQVNAINTFFQNTQSMQQISTGAGKCLTGDTELEVDIDINSDFGKFLLNKVSTGAGNNVTPIRNNSKI